MSFKYLKIIVITIISAFILNSCAGFGKTDTRKVPIKASDRARKNIEEGRGVSLKDFAKGGKMGYEFASSNPMWRASLEILDFLPLVTVDYSGGIIITDWYNDSNSNDSIKVSVRFLSNEIQTNSLKVIVHQKKCDGNNNCTVNIIDSKIKSELTASILKKASLFKSQDKKKKK
jgi:hypothetical protein